MTRTIWPVLAGWLWFASHALAADASSLESALQRLDQLERQVNQLTGQGGAPVMPANYVNINHLSSKRGGAAAECSNGPLPCSDPLVCPGWEYTAELLYLKVRQRGLDFAITEDGTALSLGVGQVHHLDYDRDVGSRQSLGYRTKTGWTLRFAYTYLETDGIAYATRPDGIGQLFATRSQPGGAEEANAARAASAFDYRLFDLQAERWIFQNKFAQLDVFGGVRYADIRQRFDYAYHGRDFTNGIIRDITNMDGFGLRLGSQGRWKMACGLSVFGNCALGMTYGRFDTSYYESNLDDTILLTSVTDDYDQAVASLDARLGLAYTLGWATVSAGYEMANWFNLSERAIFTDDIQESTYAPLAQDVLLEGLFASLDVRF